MTIVWTALPAGIRLDRRRRIWVASVSVFVTPRLEPEGASATLADYPAFVDWPQTVGGVAFRVQLGDGAGGIAETEARAGSPTGIAPDSVAWRAIFDRRTVVRAFDAPEQVPASKTRMLAYDSREVVRAVRDVYARTLSRELGLKSAPPALDRFALQAAPERLTADELIERWDGTADPLERFALYHRRVEATGTKRLAESPDDHREFHRMVGSLSTHPQLLRKLGLVLDFTIPAAELDLDEAIERPSLRVEPIDAAIEGTVHVCPWTAVELDAASGGRCRAFTTAHRGWVRRRGLLLLGGRRTAVVQEQHEHATFSLIQHSDTESAGGEKGALPALLQGGMRVVHAEAAASLHDALRDQARLEGRLRTRKGATGALPGLLGEEPDEMPLFAEQLTRGYRIDVRDVEDEAWRSLCRRRARYEAGEWSWPPPQEPLEEEGAIEPSAQTDEGVEQRVLRAPDDLFEWDGWSLVVPRPGEAVDGRVTPPEPTALEARFEVAPGSLQPQRFGHSYQFRARLVDVAGNSLTVEEADELVADPEAEGFATPPIRCLRVESAKPPELVRAQPRGPGEAGDVIVLRDAEARTHRTVEVRHHLLPPRVSLRLAERHGLFDGMTARESWRLIRTHRGELPEQDGAFEIESPYLPDPMVRQAVLELPDSAGTVDMPAFDELPLFVGGAVLARSCALVVRQGEEVRARSSGRQVVVELPKGRVHTLRVAAKLSPDDLAMLAQCEWLGAPDPGVGSPPEGERASRALPNLHAAAARGDLAVIAPSREIIVVCATQRPVSDPRFGAPLILPRDPDTTTAMLADEAFRFDRPSSGRIDVYARWQEPLDDPADEGWRIVEGELHAVGVSIAGEVENPLDPAEASGPGVSELSHDFGDTKHREVVYRAVATSRFVDFYPRSLTDDPDKMTRVSEPVALHVAATAPPAPPDVAYVVPTLRRVDPPRRPLDIGTEHRTVLVGGGLRVYMNRGWFSSGAGERLAVVVATPRTPAELRKRLSLWGENPVRDAAPLPGALELDRVRNGWRRFDDWRLDEGPVGLVAHEVQFGEEQGLPFADIELSHQPSFMPLVRLALARYQEHAIDGCKLSRIVHADFVPLTPGRSLTVRKTANDAWSLVVRGFSYGESGPETSVVRVHLEVMPEATPEETAAWRPLGEATLLEPSSREPYHFQWSGQLRIDDPRYLSGAWRRRLVVEELEPFESAAGDRELLDRRSRLISAHSIPV